MCGGSSLMNKAKPYVLMVALQFGIAGTVLFGMTSVKHGVNRFVFSAYRNAFAALCLAPFAFFLDRSFFFNLYPPIYMSLLFFDCYYSGVGTQGLFDPFRRKVRPKMTLSVFLQIMLLGFLEY